jgi:prepilin peptidase CpaA
MLAWSTEWITVAGLLAIAAASDVALHRIPNAISVAVAVTGVAAAVVRSGWAAALSALAALGVVFAVLFVAWRRRTLGGGDLKLAAAAATWVGFEGLGAYAVVSALAFGAFAGVSYLASSRAARREIRANLALAGHGVSTSIEIGASRGRVPVPAGAAFAVGALCALILGG